MFNLIVHLTSLNPELQIELYKKFYAFIILYLKIENNKTVINLILKIKIIY